MAILYAFRARAFSSYAFQADAFRVAPPEAAAATGGGTSKKKRKLLQLTEPVSPEQFEALREKGHKRRRVIWEKPQPEREPEPVEIAVVEPREPPDLVLSEAQLLANTAKEFADHAKTVAEIRRQKDEEARLAAEQEIRQIEEQVLQRAAVMQAEKKRREQNAVTALMLAA